MGLAARTGDDHHAPAGRGQLVAQAGDGVSREVGVEHGDVRDPGCDQLLELRLRVRGGDVRPQLLGERGGHAVGDDG